MDKCNCYHQHGLKDVCYGTKEMEECSCGGDESKCNFYPEKRKPKMATEKRLIDAMNTVTKISKRVTPLIAQGCHQQRVHAEVLQVIAEAPTVDAVEVVRCKDCKHWHDETGWCYHHSHFVDSKGGFCHPWESNDWKMLNEDDFCSYGERKGND